jgi:hypothetical protein
MSITITVETGAVVTGANSFISLADFQAYHAARGNALTAYTDEQQKASLVKAGDYLNGIVWKGVKTGRDNPMPWPRYGTEEGGSIWNQLVYPASEWVGVLDKDGFYIPTDEVPVQVINAQCEAAYLILGGESLQPTLSRGGQLKRQRVDVIEKEWFPGASPTNRYLGVEALLKGLLRSGMSVETVRS